MKSANNDKKNQGTGTNNGKRSPSNDAKHPIAETTLIFRRVYLLPVTRLLTGLLRHEFDGVRAWAAMALRDVVVSHIFAFTVEELSEMTLQLNLCALEQKHPQLRACLFTCINDVMTAVTDLRASMRKNSPKHADSYRNN